MWSEISNINKHTNAEEGISHGVTPQDKEVEAAEDWWDRER